MSGPWETYVLIPLAQALIAAGFGVLAAWGTWPLIDGGWRRYIRFRDREKIAERALIHKVEMGAIVLRSAMDRPHFGSPMDDSPVLLANAALLSAGVESIPESPAEMLALMQRFAALAREVGVQDAVRVLNATPRGAW